MDKCHRHKASILFCKFKIIIPTLQRYYIKYFLKDFFIYVKKIYHNFVCFRSNSRFD